MVEGDAHSNMGNDVLQRLALYCRITNAYAAELSNGHVTRNNPKLFISIGFWKGPDITPGKNPEFLFLDMSIFEAWLLLVALFPRTFYDDQKMADICRKQEWRRHKDFRGWIYDKRVSNNHPILHWSKLAEIYKVLRYLR